MKKFSRISLAIALTLAGCATATATTDDFNLFGFNESITASAEQSTRSVTIGSNYSDLKVSRGITVNFTAGKRTTTAKISGPKNLVELASVKVEKGVLKVSYSRDFGIKGQNITVDITGVLPEEYNASSGATINVNSALKLRNDLEVKSSAGAFVNFNGNVSANTVEVSASAGGGVNFNNTVSVHSAELKSSAGGELRVNNIVADEVELKASAGAELKVSGKAKEVEAKASAGAEINIKGLKSDSINVKASAGGEVNR